MLAQNVKTTLLRR